MNKNLRITYAAFFGILLVTEILIGMFVHDNFIRPYIGDLLVTILICFMCRTVFPKGIRPLPIYVFVFSALVEVAQYFQIVKLLGLDNNKLICTIVGTSFSWIDLLCYGIGCIIFWLLEKAINLSLNQSTSE